MIHGKKKFFLLAAWRQPGMCEELAQDIEGDINPGPGSVVSQI